MLRLAITLHGENRSHAAAEGRAANREDSTHATGLLTLRDVTGMTALSRSAVYALMAESRFPKPVRIGDRAVRWLEQEVLDFIASRPRRLRAASRVAR